MKTIESIPAKKEKAAEAVKAAEKKKDEAPETKELSGSELEKVSGAGDPFKDIPRTEPVPIDDDLRENG